MAGPLWTAPPHAAPFGEDGDQDEAQKYMHLCPGNRADFENLGPTHSANRSRGWAPKALAGRPRTSTDGLRRPRSIPPR